MYQHHGGSRVTVSLTQAPSVVDEGGGACLGTADVEPTALMDAETMTRMSFKISFKRIDSLLSTACV